MCGFEDRHTGVVIDVRTWCNPDATNLCSQSIGDVVAIQVHRGNDAVLFRTCENLLQKGICDNIFNDQAIGKLAPWAAIHLNGAKFFFSQLIAPIPKSSFCEFHDVAFVNQRDAWFAFCDGIFDGGTYQPTGSFFRDRLDANAACLREANRGYPHFFLKEFDELGICSGAGLVFNTCIDIFRVFAEDDHINVFRVLYGRRHAIEVTDRADARIQVKFLP